MLNPRALSKSHGTVFSPLVVVIALVLLMGSAMLKTADQGAAGSNMRSKSDAGTLIHQVGNLRTGIAALFASNKAAFSNSPCVGVRVTTTLAAGSTGILTLNSTTAACLATVQAQLKGPSGTDDNPISFTFGAYASSTPAPTIYAWTAGTVPLATCKNLNSSLARGFGAPAVLAVTLPASPFTVSAALAADFETALSSSHLGCFSIAGAYRVIARMNN
jgi:hypothetical protein